MKKAGKYIFRIGLSLLVAGFLYDILFAGIPYQDAPVDLQNKYDRNQKIASWLMMSGLVAAVTGGLIRLASRIWQRN